MTRTRPTGTPEAARSVSDPLSSSSRQPGQPSADPKLRFPLSADPGSPSPDTDRPDPSASTAPGGADTSASGTDDAPGVGESIGRVRSSVRGLVTAHVDLLKAELAVSGRDLGIIAGLVLAAISFVVVALLLVAIGTFLFLGEWLFGSMAWGILHGTLFLVLLCVPIGINLAGGSAAATVRGVALGLVVTLLLWLRVRQQRPP